MDQIYKPDEDSFLLFKYVERLVSGSVLDMGTGSGIQAIAAAKKREVYEVMAVDINPNAIEEALRRSEQEGVSGKIEFKVSNLFDGLGCRKFDWIIFNPPYLPSEGAADETSWVGGEYGYELLLRFLDEAFKHLNLDGGILLVYSSLSGMDLAKIGKGYKVVVLEEKPLFFESLYCVMLTRVNPS